MAVTVTAIDSVNYPDNPKTLSVDVKSLVDFGSGGDELWFLVVSTSSRGPNSTSIDDELASYMLNGYSKTSGIQNPPYTVASGTNHLKVSIDGSVAREIAVTPGTYVGESLADHLEEKIRELAEDAGSEAGNLSFKNASVDFVNGRVRIKSGTTSNVYTGTGKSSVAVTDGTTSTGLIDVLGFDLPFESETLEIAARNSFVTQVSSSSSGTTLHVSNGASIDDNDALQITDGTNTENVLVSSGNSNTLTLASALNNTFGAGARVSKLVLADPDGTPPSPLNTVDKVLTAKISSIVSQIDFSA